MNAVLAAATRIAAIGLVTGLCEALLPADGVGKTARITTGLLFFAALAEQILGLIPS